MPMSLLDLGSVKVKSRRDEIKVRCAGCQIGSSIDKAGLYHFEVVSSQNAFSSCQDDHRPCRGSFQQSYPALLSSTEHPDAAWPRRCPLILSYRSDTTVMTSCLQVPSASSRLLVVSAQPSQNRSPCNKFSFL